MTDPTDSPVLPASARPAVDRQAAAREAAALAEVGAQVDALYARMQAPSA